MTLYRQAGGRLAAYIRSSEPTTQQIQAFLGDLLTSDDLLVPSRDLVGRQSFLRLKDLVGTGTGIAQRDACLRELSRIYLPSIVRRLGELVNGMLDLPADISLHSDSASSFINYDDPVCSHIDSRKSRPVDAQSAMKPDAFEDRKQYLNCEIDKLKLKREPRQA